MHSYLTGQRWRIAFVTSTLFAVTMASLPNHDIPGDPPDTLLHIFAFFVLTVLAQLAFPSARAWSLLLGLGTLGAGIEFIQAIPAVGRDASLTDWLADMAAIGLGIVVFQAICRLLASRSYNRDTETG